MSALISYQIPTPEDAKLAVESSRLLAACIGKGESACLRLREGDETLQVPLNWWTFWMPFPC